MYVFRFYVDAVKIFIHLFSHSFSKRCYQHPIAFCNPFIDLIQKVINLIYAWSYFNGWIEQTCWPNNLFYNYATAFLQFKIIRCCRNKNGLIQHRFKFMKVQWTIIQGRWQTKTIINEN